MVQSRELNARRQCPTKLIAISSKLGEVGMTPGLYLEQCEAVSMISTEHGIGAN